MSRNFNGCTFSRVNKDRNLNNLGVNENLIVPSYNTLPDPQPREGRIIYNYADATFYGSDGIQWIPFSGELTTLTNAGGTVSLVNDGLGPELATKGLSTDGTITLTDNATDVELAVNAAPLLAQVELNSAGAGVSLVNDGTGPVLANKSLTSTDGSITITDNNPTVDLQVTTPFTPAYSALSLKKLVEIPGPFAPGDLQVLSTSGPDTSSSIFSSGGLEVTLTAGNLVIPAGRWAITFSTSITTPVFSAGTTTTVEFLYNDGGGNQPGHNYFLEGSTTANEGINTIVVDLAVSTSYQLAIRNNGGGTLGSNPNIELYVFAQLLAPPA